MMAAMKVYKKGKQGLNKASGKIDEVQRKGEKMYKAQVQPMIRKAEQGLGQAQKTFESQVKPGLQRAQASGRQLQQYQQQGKQLLQQYQPQLQQITGDPQFQQITQGMKQMGMNQLQARLPQPMQQQLMSGPQQQGNWIAPQQGTWLQPPSEAPNFFQSQPQFQQTAPPGWIYVGTQQQQGVPSTPPTMAGGHEKPYKPRQTVNKSGLWWLTMK